MITLSLTVAWGCAVTLQEHAFYVVKGLPDASKTFMKKPSVATEMSAASSKYCVLGFRNDPQQRLGAFGTSSSLRGLERNKEKLSFIPGQ